MTERIETHGLARCFGAHRKLFEGAGVLARHLSTATDEGYLMHLGASCMRIAAHAALQANDPREALRRWRECMLAEQQIRLATYQALRAGTIETRTYDAMFALARAAARVREDERQRLRRELHRLTII